MFSSQLQRIADVDGGMSSTTESTTKLYYSNECLAVSLFSIGPVALYESFRALSLYS